MGGHLQQTSIPFQHWLAAQHMALHQSGTYEQVANLLQAQAGTLAFVDVFKFTTLSFFVVMPLLLLLKRTRPKKNSLAELH